MLNYAPLINAGISLLMLIVWVIYLDLFWRSYRRQHRAKIVIGHGEGMGLDSLCLVSNMSAEPIHIEGVIVVAERDGRRWAKAVTSISDIEDGKRAKKPRREGPLKSGDYIVLGTFRQLLDLARSSPADPPTDPPADPGEDGPPLDTMAIWVVADLSTESELVFARRQFLLRCRGRTLVFRPEELETRLIRSARERREIEQILQSHLEEAVDRSPEPGRAAASGSD